MKKEVGFYTKLPYTIEITTYKDGGYFAKVKELEGCMTEGGTLEEVIKNIEDAKKAWIETALESGIEIPLPGASSGKN
jgi:antitoxin HicB